MNEELSEWYTLFKLIKRVAFQEPASTSRTLIWGPDHLTATPRRWPTKPDTAAKGGTQLRSAP